MLAPPFIVTGEEIGEIVTRFTAALERVEVDASSRV